MPDFTSRLLALLGLDFDFTVDMRGESFSAITPSLHVGVRPSAEDVPALKDKGITHVVSCLEDPAPSTTQLQSEGFTTLAITIRDGMDQDIAAFFPKMFAFASQAHDDPSHKMLVHCEAGVSRSATLATAWLMKSERLTFLEAFTRLKDKRQRVLPNIGFASQLQRFEHALFPERTDELSSLARYLREVCAVPTEVEVVQEFLEQNDYDAPRALRAIFGGEIPRVVQGVRL